MALGPGKYDDICTFVRRQAGIGDNSSGGVIVIVVGGQRGNGFSCQADLATTLALPDMLESVARQMRGDAGPIGSDAAATPTTPEAIMGVLAKFHRNSCYPEALDGELRIYANEILALSSTDREND